jgi:hypothetical protein
LSASGQLDDGIELENKCRSLIEETLNLLEELGRTFDLDEKCEQYVSINHGKRNEWEDLQ